MKNKKGKKEKKKFCNSFRNKNLSLKVVDQEEQRRNGRR